MKRIRRGHAVSMTSFSSLSLCTHFEYLIYYFPESASQKKLIGLKISFLETASVVPLQYLFAAAAGGKSGSSPT